MAIINDEAEIKLNDWSEEDYEMDVSTLISHADRQVQHGDTMSSAMHNLNIFL